MLLNIIKFLFRVGKNICYFVGDKAIKLMEIDGIPVMDGINDQQFMDNCMNDAIDAATPCDFGGGGCGGF